MVLLKMISSSFQPDAVLCFHEEFKQEEAMKHRMALK
jgi:hypothetical protein